MSMKWKLVQWLVPRRNIEVDGVSFNLSCSNWITHFRWYLFKDKETEVRTYINKYVKEGDVFFDIGANVGVFSVYCAKKFDNISVYCFEPEYSNLSLLKENVWHNNLMDKVSIYGLAVSDFSGMSNLHIQDALPGAAAHTESQAKITTTDEGYHVVWREGVVAQTLDNICRETSVVPNALKIDTDGNEEKILRGGEKILADSRLRSLVLEMPMNDNGRAFCERTLKKCGFVLDWANRETTRNEIWIKPVSK